MADAGCPAVLERLREFVATRFAVPYGRPDPSDSPAGKVLAGPGAGTPGVGDWYTAVVYLRGARRLSNTAFAASTPPGAMTSGSTARAT